MVDDGLGLFAKHWQPGQVKTRLAQKIGSERAAAVYFQFVTTLLDRFRDFGKQQWVAYTPSDSASEFETLLPVGWQLEPQSTGDLGERMRSFFERRFVSGCSRVVLLGSDSPNVPLEYIRQAFDHLNRQDVVLGPTEDGGYWLVGAAGKVPEIFNSIPWSTPQVWSATLAAIRTAELSHAELPTWYDVDEYKDLVRLISDLGQTSHCEPALDQLRANLMEQEHPS